MPEIRLVLDGRQSVAREMFADASHAIQNDTSVYASSAKQRVAPRSSFEAEANSLHEVIP